MKYLYALIIILMALFLAAFMTQNGQEIVLKYFHWRTIALPLSIWMIFAFISGYALAWILLFASGMKHRVRAAGAEREARRLRSEIQNIRKDERKEPSKETVELSGKERTPLENSIEDDTYTTVKFPAKTEEEDQLPGGEEEKGKS